MGVIRIGGQTLYEMSEAQLKNLLNEYRNNQEVTDQIIRILQTKTRIHRAEARLKHQADEEFIKNNF